MSDGTRLQWLRSITYQTQTNSYCNGPDLLSCVLPCLSLLPHFLMRHLTQPVA